MEEGTVGWALEEVLEDPADPGFERETLEVTGRNRTRLSRQGRGVEVWVVEVEVQLVPGEARWRLGRPPHPVKAPLFEHCTGAGFEEPEGSGIGRLGGTELGRGQRQQPALVPDEECPTPPVEGDDRDPGATIGSVGHAATVSRCEAQSGQW